MLQAFRARQKAKSGENAARAYDELQNIIFRDSKTFIDLLLHWKETGFSERELIEFYHYASHGGSVSKKDNPLLVNINPILRENQNLFPISFQDYLNWLKDIHDY